MANLIARNSIESIQFEELKSDKKKKKKNEEIETDIDPDGLEGRKKKQNSRLSCSHNNSVDDF